MDIRKSATTTERIITDRSYSATDCYTCKSAATTERPFTDRSYSATDGYACKSAAIIESKGVNNFGSLR